MRVHIIGASGAGTSTLGAALAARLLLGGNWYIVVGGLAGGLFGEKIVLNEFVGFIDLEQAKGLSEHTVAIVTFALCGFANFGSLGIMLGGLCTMAPARRL